MNRAFILVAISCLLTIGCGSGLKLSKVDAAYKKPSNVAVFFQVRTRGGDPVGGLQATDFRIYENGELVSLHESKQTIVSQEIAAEHYTLLLVDMSGSVTESDQAPLLDEAAREFTSTVESHQRVAVYAFDGSPEIHPIAPFTRPGAPPSAGINRLGSFRTKDPSTNLNGAIVQAIAELDKAIEQSKVPLRFGTIVVFTDGTDRAHRVTQSDTEKAAKESGYDIFAIGLGDEIDEKVLSKVGRSGYVLVEDKEAIKQAFEDIGQKIVAYTQSYYLLSYCSPARAGVHEVTVEAVAKEASGKLTYEFDAENFEPKCDPNAPPPFETKKRHIEVE